MKLNKTWDPWIELVKSELFVCANCILDIKLDNFWDDMDEKYDFNVLQCIAFEIAFRYICFCPTCETRLKKCLRLYKEFY